MPAKAVEALTLREVADDVRAWLDTIDGLDDADEPAREVALQAQARAIAEGSDKVERFGRFLQRCKAEREYIKTERERLLAKSKLIESVEDRLREYAIEGMQANDHKVLRGNTLNLSVVGCPPSVVIVDEAAVPAEYQWIEVVMRLSDWRALLGDTEPDGIVVRAQKSIDKTAIANAIKAGAEVPGADLQFSAVTLRVK